MFDNKRTEQGFKMVKLTITTIGGANVYHK